MAEHPVMDPDHSTVTPGLVCVECGYEMDRTSGARPPEPDDWTLCIRCGSLNVFDDGMKLRPPTVEEMCAAAADSGVQRLRRAILAAGAASLQDDNRPNGETCRG